MKTCIFAYFTIDFFDKQNDMCIGGYQYLWEFDECFNEKAGRYSTLKELYSKIDGVARSHKKDYLRQGYKRDNIKYFIKIRGV